MVAEFRTRCGKCPGWVDPGMMMWWEGGSVVHAECLSEKPAETFLCQGKTRKGESCRVMADPGQTLCHIHRPDGVFQEQLRRSAAQLPEWVKVELERTWVGAF